MITYFCLYAFLGYFMESTYVSILQRKFISSGLLKGPFIPLYGLGACLLIIMSPYLHLPLEIFIVGAMTMTILEYLTSLYIEHVFHTKCWDYSNHHCQFQGRICLLYSLIWGLLSYYFLTYIHPFFLKIIPLNDFTTILSLIILTIIIKAFLQRHHSVSKTFIKPKEKESSDSLT